MDILALLQTSFPQCFIFVSRSLTFCWPLFQSSMLTFGNIGMSFWLQWNVNSHPPGTVNR